MLLICSDITKLKEVEIQGQKMRNTFFSSVAHELRTPLNSIIPILRLLMAQFLKIQNLIPGADRVFNLISLVLNAALHLESVIEDALDLSRIENNKFTLSKENFNVYEAVEEVCDIMRFQIEAKALQLNVKISNQVPTVIFSDKKRFKQILFNLIGNAIKFTYTGCIRVEVSLKEHQKTKECQLIVSIIDSGIGIKPEDLQKLFQFFGMLSKSKGINRSGMGLGLTISKMIIRELGGQIEVTSTPNVGSNFTLGIPLELEKVTIQPKNDAINQSMGVQDSVFYEPEQIEDFASSKYEQLIGDKNINRVFKDLYTTAVLQHKPSTQISGNLFNFESKRKLSANLGFKSAELSKFLQPLCPQVKQKRILCVDDSTYNLFVLQELIKSAVEGPLEIDTALNGQLALDQIERTVKNQGNAMYDFIFLDLMMPVLDGYQTCEQLRQMQGSGKLDLSKTAIIAISAVADENFRSNDLSRNFDIFLGKPVDYETLKQTLDQANSAPWSLKRGLAEVNYPSLLRIQE
ncbi:hypothetical protein FGO68_gene1251 [Halteria grandinella]|uniref:histidine kinase n=1 Tax=Halteria grandinella TaxID=5974 RepID=A0A8J8P1R2_HALGN|nr:hypothetical protein FGO68_gene1251 [Halteria grandinella]